MSRGFAPLPAWLLPRSDVSWAAKALFALLERYTGRGRRVAHPSIDALCADMGSPRRSVERWLLELESAGLLERTRTGRECIYRLAGEPVSITAISGASDPPESADRPESRGAEVGASDPPELAHQREPIPFSQAVEDQKSGSQTRAGAREPTPQSSEPDRDPELVALVLDGFARRWATACGKPWDRSEASPERIAAILEVVGDRPSTERELDRGLDAYFAHCAALSLTPEFGTRLTRDFSMWCSSSSLPAISTPSHEKRGDRYRRLAEKPIPAPQRQEPAE